MDVLSLVGKWIVAKKDFTIEIFTLDKYEGLPKIVNIKKGEDFIVTAALKGSYGDSKLILINWEKEITLPVEFSEEFWELIKEKI